MPWSLGKPRSLMSKFRDWIINPCSLFPLTWKSSFVIVQAIMPWTSLRFKVLWYGYILEPWQETTMNMKVSVLKSEWRNKLVVNLVIILCLFFFSSFFFFSLLVPQPQKLWPIRDHTSRKKKTIYGKKRPHKHKISPRKRRLKQIQAGELSEKFLMRNPFIALLSSKCALKFIL